MNPIEPSDDHVAYWAAASDIEPMRRTIGGPEEAPDVIPCPTLITANDGHAEFHVPFKLDEIELAHLAQGGTLWLTTWGHLPIHRLEVQPPSDRTSP